MFVQHQWLKEDILVLLSKGESSCFVKTILFWASNSIVNSFKFRCVEWNLFKILNYLPTSKSISSKTHQVQSVLQENEGLGSAFPFYMSSND